MMMVKEALLPWQIDVHLFQGPRREILTFKWLQVFLSTHMGKRLHLNELYSARENGEDGKTVRQQCRGQLQLSNAKLFSAVPACSMSSSN